MTEFMLAAHGAHLPILVAYVGAVVPSLPADGSPPDVFSAADNLKAGIYKLLGYFLPIGVALCALYFAWGGLHYITAGSNPILVQKARTIWWHAAVGLVGVILATPLVNTIQGLFK